MNQIPTCHELVTLDGDKLVTDSRILAKTFKKRHDNVLRAYDNLECSDKFSQLNFELVEFVDEKRELRRSVKMTKNAFAMLAMGFTGKHAAEFKEAYVNAFDS